MAEEESLREIVADLIAVMHLQAKELEKLVVQIEQVTDRLPGENRLSLVVSELSELKTRTERSSASTGVSASSLERRLPVASRSVTTVSISSLTPAIRRR